MASSSGSVSSEKKGGRAIIDTAEVAESRRLAAERLGVLVEKRDALGDDPTADLEQLDREIAALIGTLAG